MSEGTLSRQGVLKAIRALRRGSKEEAHRLAGGRLAEAALVYVLGCQSLTVREILHELEARSWVPRGPAEERLRTILEGSPDIFGFAGERYRVLPEWRRRGEPMAPPPGRVPKNAKARQILLDARKYVEARTSHLVLELRQAAFDEAFARVAEETQKAAVLARAREELRRVRAERLRQEAHLREIEAVRQEERRQKNREMVERNRERGFREWESGNDEFSGSAGEWDAFLRLFDDDPPGGYSQCFESDRQGRDIHTRNIRWLAPSPMFGKRR